MRLTGVDAAPLDLELFVCRMRRAEDDGLDVAHCEDGADGGSHTFHDDGRRRFRGRLPPAEPFVLTLR